MPASLQGSAGRGPAPRRSPHRIPQVPTAALPERLLIAHATVSTLATLLQRDLPTDPARKAYFSGVLHGAITAVPQAVQGLAAATTDAVVALVARGPVTQALLGTLLDTLSHVLFLGSSAPGGVDVGCALVSVEDALLRDAPAWTTVAYESPRISITARRGLPEDLLPQSWQQQVAGQAGAVGIDDAFTEYLQVRPCACARGCQGVPWGQGCLFFF